MTTIAFDGKTLAADSLLTADGVVCGFAPKICKLNDGRHLALAGHVDTWPAVENWLNGGAKPEFEEDASVSGLVVGVEGAFEFSKSLRLFPAAVPWAGGSGAVIAMAAMKCGKSAAQAVAVACEMDIYSRGPVQKVKIC